VQVYLKKLVAAFVAIALIIVLLLTIIPSLKPKCDVGVFYYVWYNLEDPVSWESNKIVDRPIVGYYNSCDSELIKQHFTWLDELKIDFCVISWWGFYNQSDWNVFINKATSQVFRIVEENPTKVKLCIMIEPFIDKTVFPDWDYDYSEIYEYIYHSFVEPYRTIYYQYDGKPLICVFNDSALTLRDTLPMDNRFTIITIGGSNKTSDWIYTDLPLNSSILGKRQISVTPRFDDSRFRDPGLTIDANLSENVYSKEWSIAIEAAKQNRIDIITICSWNEYSERTIIEPHRDATAFIDDPYLLYEKTKKCIEELKS